MRLGDKADIWQFSWRIHHSPEISNIGWVYTFVLCHGPGLLQPSTQLFEIHDTLLVFDARSQSKGCIRFSMFFKGVEHRTEAGRSLANALSVGVECGSRQGPRFLEWCFPV